MRKYFRTHMYSRSFTSLRVGVIATSSMAYIVLICNFLICLAAGNQQYVAFDAASASSIYSAGNLEGSPAFAAQQALSGGSGYWQRFEFAKGFGKFAALISCKVFGG